MFIPKSSSPADTPHYIFYLVFWSFNMFLVIALSTLISFEGAILLVIGMSARVSVVYVSTALESLWSSKRRRSRHREKKVKNLSLSRKQKALKTNDQLNTKPIFGEYRKILPQQSILWDKRRYAQKNNDYISVILETCVGE